MIEKTEETSTQGKIDAVFTSLSRLVREKNRRYGDSAIKPLRIFSNSRKTKA